MVTSPCRRRISMADAMAALTVNSLDATGSSLTCELCAKTYDRHDLLMRHRRRCRGPRTTNLRRKACDSCVRAKARCCYSQPTCARCARRGKTCVYLTAAAALEESTSQESDHWPSTPRLNDDVPNLALENVVPSAQIFDLDISDWAIQDLSRPYESTDLILTGGLSPFGLMCEDLVTDHSLMRNILDQNQTSNASPRARNSQNNPIPVPNTISSIEISDRNDTFDPPAPATMVRILSEYSSLLSNDSYLSPLLHWTMYSVPGNVGLDMAFLPLSSMAICCGSNMSHSPDKTFFRRAMDAARQKLIQEFPTQECLGQWDALHAMLIYESIDMRESMNDNSAGWKVARPTRGLGSPFLVKMVERHASELSELRNPDIRAFSKPASSPCTLARSAWDRWKVTEKVRRTIFFANMLNFYNNYEFSAGKLSAYYSSLDDELILNMPLPCSEAAWSARDEEGWMLAMGRNASYQTNSSSSEMPSGDILSNTATLKEIFKLSNKRRLREQVGSSIGLDNSNDFRRLIINCASEQFL